MKTANSDGSSSRTGRGHQPRRGFESRAAAQRFFNHHCFVRSSLHLVILTTSYPQGACPGTPPFLMVPTIPLSQLRCLPLSHLPARARHVYRCAGRRRQRRRACIWALLPESHAPRLRSSYPLGKASRGNGRTTRPARGRRDASLQVDKVMSPRGLRTATKEGSPCPLYPEGRGSGPFPQRGNRAAGRTAGRDERQPKTTHTRRARPTRRVPRDHYAKLAHGASRRGSSGLQRDVATAKGTPDGGIRRPWQRAQTPRRRQAPCHAGTNARRTGTHEQNKTDT